MSTEETCTWTSKTKTCARPKQQTDPCCIVHNQDLNKNREAFGLAFVNELESPDKAVHDFEGWIFAEGLTLENKVFEKPAVFNGVTIHGNASFKDSEFRRNVTFEEAHFEGEVSFENAKFKTTSEIEDEVRFTKTQFKREVTFANAVFSYAVSFHDTAFQVGANFDDAHFEDSSEFVRAQFLSESATFKKTQFTGDAYIADSNFEKVAKFDHTAFHSFLSFEKSTFADGAEFSNANFEGYAHFKNTTFATATLFNDAKFKKDKDVSFENTQFNGYVSFKKTQFNRTALFTGTNFTKAFFEGTSFLGESRFEQATFNEVYFRGSKFRRLTKFEDLQITRLEFSSSSTIGDSTEFCGETVFNRIEFSDTGCLILDSARFCGTVTFDVQIDKRNQLIIHKVDLSKAFFGKSSVQNVEFEDVNWPETRFRRLKIADEPSVGTFHFNRPPADIRKLADVRRLYRQLRLNHDQAGEYETAGRFYVSESEMRYLAHPSIIRWFHLRGLYRLASRYGESIVQAAIVLILLVFLFAVAYWMVCPPQFKEAPKVLGTDFSGCLSSREAIWFSLQASKPLANLGLSPKTGYYWLVLIEGFLVPVQIALLLLAVRRRFRRGD